MARLAMQDQSERTVHVDRLKLVDILKSNLAKHVADYEEAVIGYKESAHEKLAAAEKRLLKA